MQFLVRKTTHTTGETFTDVTKIRDNEEAEKLAKQPKGLLEVIPSSFNNGPISRALSKSAIYRKDSE